MFSKTRQLLDYHNESPFSHPKIKYQYIDQISSCTELPDQLLVK